jgi:aminopeptidase N
VLISQAGRFGAREVIEEAQSRFETFVKTQELEPNLRGPVYAITAENGGAAEFEELVKIYRTTKLQEEKVRIMRSLTRFKEKAIIGEVLKFALSKDVRTQDTYAILGGFGSNRCGRHQAWEFNKKNIKELRTRYEGGSVASMLGHIFEGSTTGFTKPAELKDVQAFFAKHPISGIERTMKQALEIIRSNIRWTARGSKEASAWLASHVETAVTV